MASWGYSGLGCGVWPPASTRETCTHRQSRAKESLLRSRPGGAVAKTMVILNVNHGPWLGGDFLCQKKEALALFLEAPRA